MTTDEVQQSEYRKENSKYSGGEFQGIIVCGCFVKEELDRKQNYLSILLRLLKVVPQTMLLLVIWTVTVSMRLSYTNHREVVIIHREE